MIKPSFYPFIVFFIVLLGLNSCKDKSATTNIDPAVLAQYITAYTNGVIAKEQAVRVQFAQPMVTQAAVGQSESRALLNISPSVSGELSWENTRTLAFLPSEGWETGQTYSATVALKTLFDTITELKEYTFQFTVRESRIQVEVRGLYTPDPANMSEQAIGGVIKSNDPIDIAQLDGLISATQEGSSLPVTYLAAGDLTYDFVVTGVKRTDQASSVSLKWDAAKVNLGTDKGNLQSEVPAIGDFKVLSVNHDNEGTAQVNIRFSDPLDARQDLNGLIRIPGATNMVFQVQGNLIVVNLDSGMSGAVDMTVASGVKNSAGKQLGRDVTWQLNFTRPEPQLIAVGEEVIMPHTGKRLFPFEAVGLEAVRIEIFKVFDSNVLQFLQDNSLSDRSDSYQLQRVGRVIAQDRVFLRELVPESDLDRQTRYALDLSKYIEEDQKAIYQVRIGFGMDDVRYVCDKKLADFGISGTEYEKNQTQVIGFRENQASMTESYYGIYGYYEGFDWDDRDQICKPAYYNQDRFLVRNLISSNIGIIAKQNDDKQTVVIVTDLLTGKPLANAQVKLFDYQQQQLFVGKSDANGFIKATTDYRPDFITVNNGKDIGYLKFDYSTALEMSRFEIGGSNTIGGIKGEFYAERGVWRPGDSVFLHFVIEDRFRKLPAAYPIEFELFDAQGRLREKRTELPAAGNIYSLHFATDQDDPTGMWRAEIQAGGQSFSKNLKVETVKPNRLKIDLDFGNSPLSASNRTVNLKSDWLHGAPAKNLKADVELQIKPNYAGFDKWPGYVFHDPARELTNDDAQVIFNGQLDENGRANFQMPELGNSLPGRLTASFKTRVFEPGGNFSVDNIRSPYIPFTHLAGLELPKNRWGGNELAVDQSGELSLATVDPAGQPAAGRNLEIGIYEVQWRYWWQDNFDNVSRFNSSKHEQAIAKLSATTDRQGKASVSWKSDKYGRYLVRVCDTQSGHCSGDYLYVGSEDRSNMSKEAAAMLRLRTDRETYNIGEKVTVNIPASEGGMLLVSLENANGVINAEWVNAKAGDNAYTFTAEGSMLPNIYVNVLLIQPHANTANDKPIRMYGVVPVAVEDPTTRLQPIVKAAEEWQPEQNVSVTVSEKDGRAMSYTLAIVDEGLLGLTRFNTPDLWQEFFTKEALGVRTFDLFSQVISSMGGEFSRVLAIGGDDELSNGKDNPRANRFEPVVRHLGPFNLKKNQKATHQVKLPNYIGAVRVMVVSAGERAYGSTDQTVPVRKPLMVLPTLPRVIGPGETLEMPVNVFAMTEKVKNATVTVRETTGLVNFTGASNNQVSKKVAFPTPGDELLRFPLTVGNKLGIAKFEVIAEGNGERITQNIEIDVRNPNGYQTTTELVSIQPGETKQITYTPFGMPGTRAVTLEAGSIPPLNLASHLRYLLEYPYGCLEQTVSPAFAQLHLDKLTDLTVPQQETARKNVMAAINSLVRFQTANGSLAYWPGETRAQPWATNYALHFLLEAEAAGYTLPLDLKDKLLSFQRNAAANWRSTVWEYYVSDQQRQLDQAYRLYTLALAGQPDLGAMNRLRTSTIKNNVASYRLAAAYALAGKQNIAKDLVASTSSVVANYRELSYTFGSTIRDMAMLLESQLVMKNMDEAGKIAIRLAENVNRSRWLSTQEAAYAILAMSKLAGNKTTSKDVLVNYTSPEGKTSEVGSSKALLQIEMPTSGGVKTISLKNAGSTVLFASTIVSGQAPPGEEKLIINNLGLSVSYANMNGSEIEVSRVEAGTDFIATYTLSNPNTLGMDYREMALRSAVASGWEIVNERMDLVEDSGNESSYNYRDYRDDRVFTFFDLGRTKLKTFRLRITAAYPGRYYLPTQIAEAMYNNDIQAGTEGRWVEVF